MEWILIIAILFGLAFGVYKLAERKNRSAGGWLTLAVIFNPILIIIILALMPKLSKRSTGDENFKIKKRKKRR